jgi:menaquinol-cytochrome c reductase iron-sulfur subunit
MMAKSSQSDVQSDVSTSAPPDTHDTKRRSFLRKVAAVVIGGIAGLVPLASGLFVFFDPVRRKSQSDGFVRIATKDAVPADGLPRRFPVIKDLVQTFTRFPSQPVGMVFLRRLSESEVEAFQATCPHAGCYVDFRIEKNHFHCPCHNSKFEPDGSRISPKTCPSPRDLDTLDVDPEMLAKGEVWIQFKNFRAATPEKIAK